ncbi:hypothetical protein MRB53_040814 [Persea americana]|nr:hypothetical protein MRB53_040814 [Persea americana]
MESRETANVSLVRDLRHQTYCLCTLICFFKTFRASPSISTHPADRHESIVCEDKYTTMIRLEIVDRFHEQQLPHVLANEFDSIKWYLRSRFMG